MNLTTENQAALPGKPAGSQLGLFWVYCAGEVTRLASPVSIPDSGWEIGRGLPSMPGQPADTKLSRRHARITRGAAGELQISDLGSRNGTFVNGQAVGQRTLRAGDVIRVGNSLLVAELDVPGVHPSAIPGLFGDAACMAELRRQVLQVADSDHAILLSGESGAGKSLVARLLHEQSGRPGAFIAVGCGEVPESVFAARLFGQVAGAFPGAEACPGFFQEAHGGTLFLDEVADLSAAAQAMLRNAITDKRVTPLGASSPVQCRVRVIASTQHGLSDLVTAGRFRSDLYGRLAEFPLAVPALRERRRDILGLFLLAPGLGAVQLSPDLAEQLVLFDWPRNVRELHALGARLQLASAGSPILELDLWTERAEAVRSALSASAPPPGPVETSSERPKSAPCPAPLSRRGADSPDFSTLLGRKGELWCLRWDQTEYYLPDAKGFHYLHYLLRNPNRSFAVTELLELTDPSSSADELRMRKDAAGKHLGGAVDEKALKQYKKRLTDLNEDIEEAERNNDYQRGSRLKNEREQILSFLQPLLGRGERARVTGGQAERDRVNIQRCIRRAFEAIAAHAPRLAAHLDRTVHTGLTCEYRPLPLL